MTEPDDLADIIEHAQALADKGLGAPFVRALARLADHARAHLDTLGAHLDTLDAHRNGDAGGTEAWIAEHRLRTALYGAPTDRPLVPVPTSGWLARAWHWLVRGWSP